MNYCRISSSILILSNCFIIESGFFLTILINFLKIFVCIMNKVFNAGSIFMVSLDIFWPTLKKVSRYLNSYLLHANYHNFPIMSLYHITTYFNINSFTQHSIVVRDNTSILFILGWQIILIQDQFNSINHFIVRYLLNGFGLVRINKLFLNKIYWISRNY